MPLNYVHGDYELKESGLVGHQALLYNVLADSTYISPKILTALLCSYSVCRLRIHKGTSGVITFRRHFHASFPPTYCFKIVANKGEQIRLMLKVVSSQPWCDRSCSNCPYLEIENGIHENGKPSSRICGQLLNKVTLYSHFDQSLELLFATNVTGYMYVGFQASYTVTSYKETVSNGKQTPEN